MAGALARGHLEVLVERFCESDLAFLADHLRILSEEERTAGPRPCWIATKAAVAEAMALPDPSPPGSVPPGVRFETREGRGRVLVAARAFTPGEVLLVDKPVVVIPDCQIGVRATAGPIMKEIQTRWQSAVTLDMDVICEHFAASHEELKGRFNDFECHADSSNYKGGQLAADVAAIAIEIGLVDPALREDLVHFILVLAVNVHTVGQINGIALFYWLSMFNHSCDPNAEWSREAPAGSGFVAAPRSLKHIAEGEVLDISYLSLHNLLASTALRRGFLRTQKNFDCGCERCQATDVTRLFPCSTCDGYVAPAEAGAAPRQWQCRTCGAYCDADTLPISKEEQLAAMMMQPWWKEDEQSIHSMLTIVSEDLGRGEGAGGEPAQHFLYAWVLLELITLLLTRPNAGGGNVRDDGETAARAAAVLHTLHAWVLEHLPTVLHKLAHQVAVPVVRALIDSGKKEQAAHIAANFECALGVLGAADPDVCFLANTCASVSLRLPGAWIVSCTACGACLVDARHKRRPNGVHELVGEAIAPDASSPSSAMWCSRCHLAPFCSTECEAAGTAKHWGNCITADGPP